MYRKAAALTTKAIAQRARVYRNTVVTVSLIGLGVVACAGMFGTPLDLTGLLLMFPAAVGFLWRDACTLAQWRSCILDLWVTGAVQLSPLAQALRANPALPKNTLEAMLAGRNLAGLADRERDLVAATRSAVARAIRIADQADVSRLSVRTAAGLLAVLAAWIAAHFAVWEAAAAIPATIAVVFLADKWLSHQAMRHTFEAAQRAGAEPDFDAATFEDLIPVRRMGAEVTAKP